ncbi:hypothetical protein N7540_012495 [Penicillium herquei]|nr:hypothetical protein N7540_012495 [Penicillium herquei]
MAYTLFSDRPLSRPKYSTIFFLSIGKMGDQRATCMRERACPRSPAQQTQDLPKNANNQIYCDHPHCKLNPPTFNLPFEWKRHMDAHNRPYECTECKILKGFTSRGGLTRHQREVHKKALNLLLCPYRDCYRNTGNGFKRQSYLDNHIRLYHNWMRDVSDDEKENMRAENNRLHMEIQQKDRQVEELTHIVENQRQSISQLTGSSWDAESTEKDAMPQVGANNQSSHLHMRDDVQTSFLSIVLCSQPSSGDPFN